MESRLQESRQASNWSGNLESPLQATLELVEDIKPQPTMGIFVKEK